MSKVTKALLVALAAAAVAVPVAQGGTTGPNPWKCTDVMRHLSRGATRMNPWKDPRPTVL